MRQFIQKHLIRRDGGGDLGRIVCWLGYSICLSLATLASAEVLRQTVSAIQHADLDAIGGTIWLAVLTTLWVIFFEYLNRTAFQKLCNRFGTRLQHTLLRHTMGLDKLSFSRQQTGSVLTLLQDNVESGVNGTLSTLESAVYGVGMLVFSVVYMGWLSWQLMLLVVACNLVFRMVTRFFDGKIRSFSKRVIGYVKESNSFFMEVLRSELLVRVYRREAHFEEEFQQREQKVARAGLAVFATFNGYDELTWYTSTLIRLVFIYGVGGLFMLSGLFEFSVLIAFTNATDSFVKGINAVINAISEYNITLPHLQAIEEALAVPAEETETGPVPEMGDICFQDVSFGFPDRLIFHHDLTIHQGDQVMVTGINGRGKSTLFGLLLGFYRPQSSVITIGGRDIAGYSFGTLCRLFGYIPQTPHILHGSVAENLALGEPEDSGKTATILQKLRLEGVKDGDPFRCSTGEKQRLGIGRALWHSDRPVLLGDEIFANIDPANRDAILSTLADFGRDRTVLLICHEDTDYPFTHHLHLGEDSITYTPMEVAR